MVIWLLVSRPGVLKTRFLYSIKAIRANNVDTTITGDVVENIMGDIAK